MTKTTEFDRLLGSVLEADGPQTVPAALVDAGLAEARAIGQRRPLVPVLDRRAWPAPARVAMGTHVALVGVVGIVLVAVLGAVIGGGQPQPPDVTASPSASALPSSSPSGPGPSPSATRPVVGDDEPWIVHIADTSSYGVHFVRPDGSDLHRWAAEIPGTQEHPDWSPDGRQLVIDTVDGAGVRDLWIADADGTDARVVVDCVAPCKGADEPAWSPDGASIAFQRVVLGDLGAMTSTLEILDVATGTARVVLTMPTRQVLLAPRWAPDGRRLVVEVVRLPEDDYLVDPDGGAIGIVDLDAAEPAVELLTDMASFGQLPDWSPDGEWIVWVSSVDGDPGHTEIVRSRPDGTDMETITTVVPQGAAAVNPTYTPDGTRILFTRIAAGGDTALMSSALDGTDLRVSTADVEAFIGWPRLRPQP
jgi:Tol biopolymer transport system component